MLLLLMDEYPGIELNILIHLSYNIFIENLFPGIDLPHPNDISKLFQ